MKYLLKAWREYRKHLEPTRYRLKNGEVVTYLSGENPNFTNFMDYLVNKESKRKKK